MEAYQLQQLRRLLRYAVTNVPYYRNLFNGRGDRPDDIRCLSDLSALPTTGKQQLRELYRSMGGGGTGRAQLIEHKTSGSTGIPLRILRSAAEERRLNMLHWRMHLMSGLRPGERMAIVKTTWENLPQRFERLKNLVQRAHLIEQRVFDCYLPPAEIYRQLVEYQPHVIGGYPGILVKIALQHAQRKSPLNCLRKVLCGGECLGPHQRRILEDSFETPVFDIYRTTECNLVAWQCPQTGLYHVCDDGIVLEICRDGVPLAPGETGEVVITSLHSRVLPIIRYPLGDLAVAGPTPCPCGSPFSTISGLRGRVIDFLTLADGRQLQPFQLLNEVILAAGEWVGQYQIIQETLDRFRMLIAPLRPVTSAEESRLRASLLHQLGAGTQLQIEWVSDIPGGENGKFHFCRSLVSSSKV